MIKIQRFYESNKWLLSDIRFWLVFFFILRLIGITNAPLEMGHSWRQSLTAMIARNFYETGANLLYPVIDLAGEKTGIIGSEFPLFNYLIYLVAEIFGYQHWYGRLINLTVTTIGIYYYFKTIKGLTTERIAYFATLLLSVSIWFGFGRKIMPDTFSVALMLIGLYHAYTYLKDSGSSTINLLGFFLFSTLGILCKIPALGLLSVLGVILFIPSLPRTKVLWILISGSISFAITCLWYFYWTPYLVDTYGYQLYFPRSLAEGLHEVMGLIPELLEKFYFVAFSSFVAFGCFLAGIFFIIRRKAGNKYYWLALGIMAPVFILFIIKTGIVFPLHSYYIVPFVPIMAIAPAYLLATIKPKYATWLMVIISIEAIGNHQDDMFLKNREMYKLTLEDITAEHVPTNKLIIINGGPSPQDIYFSHRKGWTVHSTVIQREGYVDSLTQLGASYLIWDNKKGNLQQNFGSSVYKGEHYEIQRLSIE